MTSVRHPLPHEVDRHVIFAAGLAVTTTHAAKITNYSDFATPTEQLWPVPWRPQ